MLGDIGEQAHAVVRVRREHVHADRARIHARGGVDVRAEALLIFGQFLQAARFGAVAHHLGNAAWPGPLVAGWLFTLPARETSSAVSSGSAVLFHQQHLQAVVQS